MNTFTAYFWAWLLLYSAIMHKSEDKYVVKAFNWSEVHLSERTSYKIHTLTWFPDVHFLVMQFQVSTNVTSTNVASTNTDFTNVVSTNDVYVSTTNTTVFTNTVFNKPIFLNEHEYYNSCNLWKFCVSCGFSGPHRNGHLSRMFSIKFPDPWIFSGVFSPNFLDCAILKNYGKKRR